MANPIYTTARTVVQTARTLPAADAGWESWPTLELDMAKEGQGQVLGFARFSMAFGVRTGQGGRQFFSVGEAPNINRSSDSTLAGAFVRVLVESAAGSVILAGVRYAACWWGVMEGPTVQPDGAVDTGGRAGWIATGIGAVLAQVQLSRGYAELNDGTVATIGQVPIFNRKPGGDRSTATKSVNGRAVYVHSLNTTTSGNQWTAKQILDHIAASVTGFTLTISDPLSALTWIPDAVNLDGASVLQAINLLVNPARGLTWRATVSGATLTLTVTTTTATAISIGAFTLPAATATTYANLLNVLAVEDFHYDEDYSGVVDRIEIHGARPWVGMTLMYDDTANAPLYGYGAGWSAAADTLWNSDPTNSLTDMVFRRFEMNPSWNGQQYNNSAKGLRHYLAISPAYGPSGADGTRSYDAANFAPSFLVGAERDLPCSPGFSTLVTGPRQMPVVVVGAGSAWEDMTVGGISSTWGVRVDDDPPSVIVDDGNNGQDFEARINSGTEILLVSVGLREVDPLLVAWQSTAPLNSQLRTKVISLPQCEQWIVLAGTVTGVNSAGTALTTVGGDFTIRDDVPRMREALALAIARYASPKVSTSFSARGVFDTSPLTDPGRILTEIRRGDRTVDVQGVFTSRTWRRAMATSGEGLPVQYWITDYEAAPMDPDIEAVL